LTTQQIALHIRIKQVMSYKEQIIKEKMPLHVAVIMDGNGRWAKNKGSQRIVGHKSGVTAVRETVEAAAEIGLKYLSLYAFSTENWSRPPTEIRALMALLLSTLKSETKTLLENNVRLISIGNHESLPADLQKELKKTIERTASNTGTTLNLALSYSSHWEILQAVQNIAKDIQSGKISPEVIDHCRFEQYLTTSNIPDPELLIRTSGEFRVSNFLLWQIAYAELYFTETLWPDFRKEDFYKAICNFQMRERRFGKISEQVIN
jgi:undecaprenyl diphosphate synthase